MKNSVKLLDLEGKELEKALDEIIAKNPQRYAIWTEKEDEILTRLYGKIPNVKLRDVLGKTRSMVDSRIIKLKLREK